MALSSKRDCLCIRRVEKYELSLHSIVINLTILAGAAGNLIQGAAAPADSDLSIVLAKIQA